MTRGVAYAEAGQTLVEWAVIASLVAVLSIVAVGFLGRAVGGVEIQNCRQMSCPDGPASRGKTCDDPPVVCGAFAP